MGGTIAFAVVYIASIYRRERIGQWRVVGQTQTILSSSAHRTGEFHALGIVLLTLTVLLPQIRARLRARGLAGHIVIVFDDSRSMSIVDSFHDPLIREKADKLKKEWEQTCWPWIETIQRQIEELQRKLASQPASVEAAEASR